MSKTYIPRDKFDETIGGRKIVLKDAQSVEITEHEVAILMKDGTYMDEKLFDEYAEKNRKRLEEERKWRREFFKPQGP